MNRPIQLVNITGLVIGVSYGLHGPVLPVFAKNAVGATYAELGLIGVANFLPYMIIPLLVGILLDRFNSGHLLAIGVVLNAASVYMLSVAQSVPEIVGFRLVSGVAHAFFWPPCESIISDHSKGGERVKNISKFVIFFVTGFMLGPLAGAWILDGLGSTYAMLFEMTALVMAAAVVSSLLVARHHIRSHHRRFEVSSLVDIVRFPGIVVVLLFCTIAFGMMLTVYPAHLSDRGIGEGGILVLYFIFGVARVAGLAVSGMLARHAGAALPLGILGVSAGFGVSAFAGTFAGFLAALVLMGIILSAYLPLTLEAILVRTRSRSTGPIIGAYETLFGAGWLAGPAIGGLVTDAFGGAALYIGMCAAGASAAALAAIFKRDLHLGRAHHHHGPGRGQNDGAP